MALSQRTKGRPDDFENTDNGRPSTRKILLHAEALESGPVSSRSRPKGPRKKNKNRQQQPATANSTPLPKPTRTLRFLHTPCSGVFSFVLLFLNILKIRHLKSVKSGNPLRFQFF